jgi:hypothetical protein
MVLTTIFEGVTIVDHGLQLRRVAKAIAEDIHIKTVKT